MAHDSRPLPEGMRPFVFRPLDEPAPAASVFTPMEMEGALDDVFQPLDGGLPTLGGSGGSVSQPDQRAEMDPYVAYETGRQAGHDERDDEVAALRDEVAELQAALEACKASAEKRTAFAERTAAELRQAWEEACREMQTPMVALAVETAEAVLDAPLSPEQRAAAEAGLAAALDALVETAPLTVGLHPIDLLHLQETGLADALESTHPGLRWASDTALAEGDWTVTAAHAAVRRIRSDMIAALRGRLQLD